MTGSIFSSYSSAENRVTACFLAVLRSLAVHRIERILGSLLDDEEFSLITMEPQPSMDKGAKGQTKPDGEIFSVCQILIETKIVVNGLREEQLRGHLAQLRAPKQEGSFLLALTPDTSQPAVIDTINKKQLRWASFAALNGSIEDVLQDEEDVISEREEFLLREFQKLLADEGLLEPEKNVVVIAARIAWETYQKYHVYVCRANRPLGQAKYMAFYAKGKIQPYVPEILEKHPAVVFEHGKHSGNLGQMVNNLLDTAGGDVSDAKWHHGGIQLFPPGGIAEVVLLTPPGDSRTVTLSQPVVNDQKARSGKNVAFTMWQRYVSLPKLKQAKTTSQLDIG
jgi:hypothetical protein